jgi:hypothetical protein
MVNGDGAADLCALFLDAEDRPLTGFAASVVDATK